MARKALIVEDEPAVGQMLAEHLRAWGFEPTLHYEGRLAVEWARRHRPDLIVLDLMLPDANGYAICQELKLERETNLIPVVIVTARDHPKDRIQGLEVGANYYLTKPFEPKQLHAAIEHALLWRADLEDRGLNGEVHFRLPSSSPHLEELNQLLASLYCHTSLSQADVQRLALAVRELGANAIKWGHQNRPEEILTVIYHIDAEKVTLLIRDNGPGFDPQNLPHAAQADDPIGHMDLRLAMGMPEGGLGILMTRGLVDELAYNDTGNEARLVKRFSPKRENEKSLPSL